MSDLDPFDLVDILDRAFPDTPSEVLVADVRALAAEVQRLERLGANQLPDGGVWITHEGHRHNGELCSTGREPDTHERAVWLGPIEPIADVAE